MRIVIHENGAAKDIKLLFPTGLIFNPVSALIAHGVIRRKTAGGKKLSEKILEKIPADGRDRETEEGSDGDVTEESLVLPEGVHLRRRDLIRLCNEINRMKRMHRDMPLVDVLDSGGDSVKIYL